MFMSIFVFFYYNITIIMICNYKYYIYYSTINLIEEHPHESIGNAHNVAFGPDCQAQQVQRGGNGMHPRNRCACACNPKTS
jgi:hypothetical protein